MHPFVGPVLLGTGGQDALVLNAQPDPHHTLSCERPWMPVVAKGTPLSVRMARGSPYS
jgi:hypothetical protein